MNEVKFKCLHCGGELSETSDSRIVTCSQCGNDFDGTEADWKKIEKDCDWDRGTDKYTVYFSDGKWKK